MRRLLLVLAVCAACATGSDAVRKRSALAPPSWVNASPSDQRFLYFVGATTAATSLSEGKAAALSSATSQVAQYIGVNVSALGEFVESTKAAERHARTDVQTESTGTIQGAEIADVYYESTTRQLGETQISRFDVWLLVRFPREAANAERARQANDQQERATHAFELLGKARAEQAAVKLIDAMRALRDAQTSLALVPGSLEIQASAAEFRTASELREAVLHLTNDVQGALRRAVITARETTLGRPSPSSVAADRVAGVFAQKGFPMLPTLPPQAGETPQNAAGRAKACGANLSIQLVSSVVRTGTLYGSQSVCVAHVQGQVLDVTTNEILATAEQESKAVKSSDALAASVALEDAGNGVASALTKALLAREQLNQ